MGELNRLKPWQSRRAFWRQAANRVMAVIMDQQRADRRDPLTGTATAEAMLHFVEAALDVSNFEGPSVAVIALGLDGLDAVAASDPDSILLGVADRLRAGVRAHDLVGRLPQGFVICLPEVFSSGVHKAAHRLQRLVAGAALPTAAGPVSLGCSIGLAFGRGPGSSARDLIACATAALADGQAGGGGRAMPEIG
ncbi:GGDEF domain-containing protein [Paracraurococcus ruber]|nr:GGDEF domain-containing protein [Paracraurococcus ruber]